MTSCKVVWEDELRLLLYDKVPSHYLAGLGKGVGEDVLHKDKCAKICKWHGKAEGTPASSPGLGMPKARCMWSPQQRDKGWRGGTVGAGDTDQGSQHA